MLWLSTSLVICAVCWSAGHDPNVRVAVLLGSMLGWCTKLSNCHLYAKDCQCVPVHSAMLSLLPSLTHLLQTRDERSRLQLWCWCCVSATVHHGMVHVSNVPHSLPKPHFVDSTHLSHSQLLSHICLCRIKVWASSDRMSWGDVVFPPTWSSVFPKQHPGVAFGVVRKKSWFSCPAHFFICGAAIWQKLLQECKSKLKGEEFHCLLRLVSICCTLWLLVEL